MKIISRIRQTVGMCRPFIKPFVWISVLITVSQLMGIIFTYCTGKFVKGVDANDMVLFWKSMAGLAAAIFVAKYIDTKTADVHIKEVITDLEKHISDLTLERSSKLSVGQVINQNSGFKQTTIQKGESAIHELAHTFFFEFVPVLVKIGATLIAFFFLKWELGLIVLSSITLFAWSSISINQRLVPRIKKNRKKEAKVNVFYWEVIKHLTMVISSNQTKKVKKEVMTKHDEYAEDHKSIWIEYIWKITFLREPFAALGQLGVIGYAGHLVMQGVLNKSDLIIAMGWSYIAFGAVGSIGNMQRRLVRNFVLTGKYFDLLDLVPSIKEIQNPIVPLGFRDKIEFIGVSFKHAEYKGAVDDEEDAKVESSNPEHSALQGVDIVIKKGEIAALVGPSGSGKTTSVNLLLRFFDPDKGKIRIDGEELSNFSVGGWRNRIGFVPQEPKLWDETLRYNILFELNGSAGSITDADLERVAKMARIDEFYPRLGSKKFDTIIGENGIQLSGGQRQRVAIARALIKNPDILILDEATNALDPTNERLVHEAIREAMKGRTGIIIAHRLSTIRRADKIIVFDKGRIVGTGTHSELMCTCKSYQELVECENEALEI